MQDNNLNNISQPATSKNEQLAEKPKKHLVRLLPFFITNGAFAAIAAIIAIYDFNRPCSGYHLCLKGVFAIFALINLIAISYIIWLIFCIIYSVKEKHIGKKLWFLPFTIMLSVPLVISMCSYGIPYIIASGQEYSEHKDFHKIADVTPEITSYETVSSIPKLNDYQIVGKDISSSELYEHNEEYLGKKVLLKGFPESNEVLTHWETGESKSLKGKERTTMIKSFDGKLFSISFIDTGSEFYEDDWKINSGSYSYSYHNYYAYVYGKISTIATNSYDNDKKAVQIIPEKIYYTEDKDLSDFLEIEKKYSICAKPDNACTEEEIENGQLVNVSVNNSEDIDFYVLKDDGENLTLLSKKILISERPIDSYKDEIFDEFTPSDPSNGFTLAPYNSLKKLYELTENWNNIPVIQDFEESLDDSYLKISNGQTSISLNGNPEIKIPGLARTRLISIEQDMAAFQKNSKIISMPCTLDFDLSKRAWGATACSIQTIDLNHNTLSNQEQTNYTYEDLFVKTLSSQNDENWPNYTLTENTAKFNYTHIVPVIEIPKTLINNK